MVQEQGIIPPSLTADKLRELILEAINAGSGNPETYHALFDHLERGLQTNDVFMALNGNGRLSALRSSIRIFGSGNTTSTQKV